MKPRVSIIMPLYNKVPYVKKAVESVLAQSYKDWELIVVDDGSKDGSPQLVLDLTDERCHMYSQGNQGASAARNTGVRLAQGELLAFLDSDDWWDETFLTEMVAFADSHPEAGLWACNYWYVKTGKTRVAVHLETGYFNYAEAYLKNKAMPVTSISVLMRKDVFEKVGGFNPQIRMAEDFDLWVRVALSSKMAFLNKPLASYNQNINPLHRMLGTLVQPENHFAFNSDYLLPMMRCEPRMRVIVDRVKITCLKQYYISPKYHHKAKTELAKIPIEDYRSEPFARYLWQPLWFLRLKDRLEKSVAWIKA